MEERIAKEYYINNSIKSDRVLVIDETGKQLGVLLTKDAVNQALERSLDLVEVSPAAEPPVCKIMDYGKHKYKLTMKERNAKKQSKVKASIQKTKEIKFKTRTGENELDWKIKQAKKFLSKGNKVKITVLYRGREITHPELGMTILKTIKDALLDEALLEYPPGLSGNILAMTLMPTTKKKK
jgi:translation initiation factor IF-3